MTDATEPPDNADDQTIDLTGAVLLLLVLIAISTAVTAGVVTYAAWQYHSAIESIERELS